MIALLDLTESSRPSPPLISFQTGVTFLVQLTWTVTHLMQIYIVDSSAETRAHLHAQLSDFLRAEQETHLLPYLSLKALSPEELKFQDPPSLCIIGEGLAQRGIAHITQIRRQLPEARLLLIIPSGLETLAFVEEMTRAGVNDFITKRSSAFEILQKIVCCAQSERKERSGTLMLVESAKGGLGVTSLTAALGDELSASGKKTLIVDLDTETQDLCRFLQVKPFINENLQLILSGQRPPHVEFVSQCVLPVKENLDCLPPCPDSDALYDGRATQIQSFFNVLRVLDSQYDAIVIDCGASRGSFLRSLYKVADKVLFVVNNDPATLHASLDKVRKLKAMLSPGVAISLVENNNTKYGLPRGALPQELIRIAGSEAALWGGISLPSTREAAQWPASGYTLRGSGDRYLSAGLTSLATSLGFVQTTKDSTWLSFFTYKRQREKPVVKQLLLPPSPVKETRTVVPDLRIVTATHEEETEIRLISGVKLQKR